MLTPLAVQSEIAATWMRETAADVAAQADHLTQLDAAIGDGDHGINMNRGFAAVGKALAGQPDSLPPGRVLILAGKTLVSTVGGASGPLWGSFFRAAGRALGSEESVSAEALRAALAAGVAVQKGGLTHRPEREAHPTHEGEAEQPVEDEHRSREAAADDREHPADEHE